MKQKDRDALKRLIHYATLEADRQGESFAAYLLALAARSIEQPPTGDSNYSPAARLQ